MSVYEKLMNIQNKLDVPKTQYNEFGHYSYRSCEDILKGLKPLLTENKAIVILKDEIKLIGDRYYLESTASLVDIENGEKIESTALAREDENKKGMDQAQITGSASSYARKYALNALFAIDDTKDSDATNTHEKENKENKDNKKSLSNDQIKRLYAKAYSKGIKREKVKEQVKKRFNKEISELTKKEYDLVCEGYDNLKVGV